MIARFLKSPSITTLIVLLIMWRLLLIHVDAPWFGHHDANGVWLSAVSRNFRTYGVDEIGPIPVLNRAAIPPETALRYVRHPPLVPWAVTLSQWLFGEHEMNARLVSIFSTMIALAGFYVLCRRLYGKQHALLCLVLFAFTPMMIYFGRMPDHEPLSLAFLMSFMAVCVNWSRKPTRGRWWLMLGLAVLAIWTGWASFFFVFFTGLFGFWKGRPALRSRMILLMAVSGLSVLSVAAFYQIFLPDTFQLLIDAFIWRTSTVSEISETFTIGEFIGQTLIHMLPYATMAGLVLGLIGIIPTIRRARGFDQAVLLALAVSGLAYILIFRSASYVHDYYKIYLIPFLMIAAANLIWLMLRNASVKRFAQPALVGMFLVSGIFSVIYLNTRYTASFADATLAFAANIAAHTEPQDVVLSDLEQANPVIEFYARRYILWNVQPDDVAAQAAASEFPVVYVYCGSDANAIATLLRDEAATLTTADECGFIRFSSE